jgi:hypothetical protein
MDEFDTYLVGKKIDPALFRQARPGQYREFQEIFAQMHPKSFTLQKLFLINQIRRQCPLQETEVKK